MFLNWVNTALFDSRMWTILRWGRRLAPYNGFSTMPLRREREIIEEYEWTSLFGRHNNAFSRPCTIRVCSRETMEVLSSFLEFVCDIGKRVWDVQRDSDIAVHCNQFVRSIRSLPALCLSFFSSGHIWPELKMGPPIFFILPASPTQTRAAQPLNPFDKEL